MEYIFFGVKQKPLQHLIILYNKIISCLKKLHDLNYMYKYTSILLYLT